MVLPRVALRNLVFGANDEVTVFNGKVSIEVTNSGCASEGVGVHLVAASGAGTVIALSIKGSSETTAITRFLSASKSSICVCVATQLAFAQHGVTNLTTCNIDRT
jgi:hypothetical protein